MSKEVISEMEMKLASSHNMLVQMLLFVGFGACVALAGSVHDEPMLLGVGLTVASLGVFGMINTEVKA